MDEERRIEQDMRLVNRNANAAMKALEKQNAKLLEFEQKINHLTMQLVQLNEAFVEIKAVQLQELIKEMGHGPTAG